MCNLMSLRVRMRLINLYFMVNVSSIEIFDVQQFQNNYPFVFRFIYLGLLKLETEVLTF